MRGYGNWALEEKATGEYAGWSGLLVSGRLSRARGRLGPDAAKRGRGYATEGALRARAYAYETLGWETAISLIAQDNAPSVRVAERLGATIERITQHEGMEFAVYRHPSARSLASSSNAIH